MKLINDMSDNELLAELGVITWNAGAEIHVSAHHSEPGKGLSYSSMNVRAVQAGFSAGWDVFDGIDEFGNEHSFYGFSVS